MEHEKEIQEIKDRLTSVESQLKRKSQSSGTFKILVLIEIIFLVLFLILIGLYQFPSRGTT